MQKQEGLSNPEGDSQETPGEAGEPEAETEKKYSERERLMGLR